MKWSSWVSVWWASGLLLLQTGMVYSNTCISSNPLKMVNGKSLQGFRIWALHVRDIVQCARACVQQTICRSFNFDNKTNFCELNSKIKDEKPEFVVDNAAMIYSDISKWEPDIFPECFNKPCPENAVCLPKTLAEPGCEFACLDIPISCSGDKKYGENQSYPCPKGQRGIGVSVCQADSTWSEINFSGCEDIFNNKCSDLNACNDINGTCSQQNTCQCKNGSVYDAEKKTCDYGMLGRPCSSSEHCKSINGSCSTTQTCECPLGRVYLEEDRLCLIDCGKPVSKDEFNISEGGTLEKRKRRVKCSEGFQAAGVKEDTIECQQNGTWSQPWVIDCRGFRFAKMNGTTGAINATEGQLEMFFRHEWRYVHKDQWYSTWTRTACESMHFTYGGSWQDAPVSDKSKLWKMNDGCNNPINCSEIKADTSSDAIRITCFTKVLNGSNVRLVNGQNMNATEGYVELLYRDKWGTVCETNWDKEDATVLCRMMNPKWRGDELSANFRTNVTVWTSGVQCTDKDMSIFECKNLGWNESNSTCLKSRAKCRT